jgi:polygalacturonase
MCHEKGGGRVVVPAGVYLSRPIELKSKVTLYLEEGAILKASPYIKDYFKIGYYHNE